MSILGFLTINFFEIYPFSLNNNLFEIVEKRKDDLNLSFDTIYDNNGVAICTAEDIQYLKQMCPDGDGGAIICWIDDRSTPRTIYAQRIDNNSALLWGINGKLICNLGSEKFYQEPQIVGDGTGGALITYVLKINGSKDIYVQRIDSNGNGQWGINGSVICNSINSQVSPEIISDEIGGYIISWVDYRAPTADIYAQKIDSNGTPQWTPNGVVITIANYEQRNHKLVSDGVGGAIITWEDWGFQNINLDIMAQRITGNGNVNWTPNGIDICNAIYSQQNLQIISNGSGGAIITWEDERYGDNDIYAQNINIDGNIKWKNNGLCICNESNEQDVPQICSDGAGGVFITWSDKRYGYSDIYAQKVNSKGNIQWQDNGRVICSEEYKQQQVDICSDGKGGAVITWMDNRTLNCDIYAQWIDRDGLAKMDLNGRAICTVDGYQFQPIIINLGSGGVLICWEDLRNGNHDIYAQILILSDISLGISFGHYYLLFFLFSIVLLTFIMKKKYIKKK